MREGQPRPIGPNAIGRYLPPGSRTGWSDLLCVADRRAVHQFRIDVVMPAAPDRVRQIRPRLRRVPHPLIGAAERVVIGDRQARERQWIARRVADRLLRQTRLPHTVKALRHAPTCSPTAMRSTSPPGAWAEPFSSTSQNGFSSA